MTVASKLLGLVSSAAPLLASALGSPLAGVAVSLIASAFGLKAGDMDGIMTAIQNDPNAAVKLREIETQHQEILAQIASNDFATEYQDRKDARGAANGGNYAWFVHFMSILVTFGFFSCVYLVFFLKADKSDEHILNMMLGSLGTCWVQVIAFYFGNIHRQ